MRGCRFQYEKFRHSLSILIIILFIAFLTPSLFSQEYQSTSYTTVEDLIEQIARESEEELDYQTLFYDITRYLEDPLDINAASREELERLHILTYFQIASLQQYIRDEGPLLTIYELPLVYGFDEGLARMIEPLVSFQTTTMSRELAGEKQKPSHQLFLRFSSVLEEQKGYSPVSDSLLQARPNDRYLGNRLKVLTKYRFRYGKKVEAGYTGEKDAGEPFMNGENKYGFDFNSAFLRVNDVGKFSTLIVGDYQIRAGQGVVLGSGLSFGKSPDIINIRKKGSPLTPYTSTDENRFMRGAAATLEYKGLSVTGFASAKNIDANTYTDTLDQETYFSSFLNNGQHSIPREFEDKDAVKETIIGTNAIFERGNLRAGATLVHYFFDASYRKRDPVSIFHFSGSSNTNLGLDYTWSGNRFILFGEGGYSSNGTFASLNGASFDLHSQVTLSVLHRYFDKAFHALYGSAFTENSDNRNENGVYTGFEILPLPNWKLTGYLDAYSFPFLKKLISKPSSGFDYYLQAAFSRRDGIDAYIRYSYKAKPENVSGDQTGIPPIERVKVSHLRFHISYPVAPGLTFQNRVELSGYEKEAGSTAGGFLAYHDILYRPSSLPLSLSFRYSMFDTEGYKSRIYTYEHDVLYAFSIPFYYDRGIRTYFTGRWQISRHADLWLKYAMTWYPDRETISSGLNEIDGHTKSDVRVQLRLKF